jgi:hypothetical protein
MRSSACRLPHPGELEEFARLVGDRTFLFVLLADREGERAIKILLEERLDR